MDALAIPNSKRKNRAKKFCQDPLPMLVKMGEPVVIKGKVDMFFDMHAVAAAEEALRDTFFFLNLYVLINFVSHA